MEIYLLNLETVSSTTLKFKEKNKKSYFNIQNRFVQRCTHDLSINQSPLILKVEF